MIIDHELVNALALKFLRKEGTNYISGTLLPGASSAQLGDADRKFSALYVESLHADSLVAGGSSADTVDGFHASSTPAANTLLALDSEGKFPDSVLRITGTITGGLLTEDLDVAAGILVDGVDISVFKTAFDAHAAATAASAHNGIGAHNHLTSATGGDLTQYASADGSGTRAAYIAERLRKLLVAGRGLSGGGLLDQDVRLDVAAGDGLTIDAANAVALRSPGSLSAASPNSAAGNHTHEVTASSDPSGESLLKSNSGGGLRLQNVAAGGAAIPTGGGVSASGDISGNRVLSTQDTFVGNNLNVGEGVLRTAKSRSAVYVNADTPAVEGAATIQPAQTSQRGLVVQGLAGQAHTAPLLSAVDENGQDLFVVRPDGTLESGKPAFVGGLSGWRITGEGDAEFRNITARGELHTSVFVANEMHAAGGTLAVMPTGVVDSPIQSNDNLIDSTFNIVVSGDPNAPAVSPFALNDVLRVKLLTGLQEN